MDLVKNKAVDRVFLKDLRYPHTTVTALFVL